MGVKVIEITGEAVTVEEACDHLRIVVDDDIESLLIQRLIKAATQHAEDYTGRSIRKKTLELAIDAFPAREIKMPHSPVMEIESVKYVDSDGEEVEIDDANYYLDDYGDVHWLIPAYGYCWPSARCQANSVKIRYVAGTEDEDVPDGLKSAILLAVADLHENRSAQTEVVLNQNRAMSSLLDNYRISYGV